MTATLDQRLAAAKDFDQLNGLANIHLGTLLLANVLAPSEGLAWFLVVAGASLAVGLVQRWWFRPRFGVQVADGEHAAWWIFGLVGFVLALLALNRVDAAHPTWVRLVPLLLAAGLAVQWGVGLRHVGTRWWHAAAVAVLGAAGLGRPLGFDVPPRLVGALAGVALLAVGALDLRRLTRILPAVPHD